METYKLSDLCEILDSKRKPLSALQRAKKQGIYPYYGAQGIIDHLDDYLLDGEYLLVAEDGANLETRNQPIANIAKGKIWVNNHAHVLGSNGKCSLNLLGFILNNMNISPYVTGCAQPKLNQENLRNIEIELPSHIDSIASILSSLDRKIELNNKINADLEEMAQAIFKNWFVDFEPFKDGKFVDSELGMIPEGWKVGRLTEIASYMNGLAMQKFPPENNEDSLPVLKIKELGQGFCGTDSDRCSCNIKDECKIHSGDVIFSWSGTLLVDVWCGGDCGLNQHLFKVISKDYPKWFYYYWTKHHLQEFIHIAKDKAVTMGHIKRGHLEEALVAIPDNDSMERAHELFEPILSKMISLRLENSRLSLLRDTLLPRLMSGELEVPE
uniref:restriction endonuclease subunit S n=1 Tax=Segatella copri TaxID=165179 RepID=UPI003566C02A